MRFHYTCLRPCQAEGFGRDESPAWRQPGHGESRCLTTLATQGKNTAQALRPALLVPHWNAVYCGSSTRARTWNTLINSSALRRSQHAVMCCFELKSSDFRPPRSVLCHAISSVWQYNWQHGGTRFSLSSTASMLPHLVFRIASSSSMTITHRAGRGSPVGLKALVVTCSNCLWSSKPLGCV